MRDLQKMVIAQELVQLEEMKKRRLLQKDSHRASGIGRLVFFRSRGGGGVEGSAFIAGAANASLRLLDIYNA